jgi:hypothetical protein
VMVILDVEWQRHFDGQLAGLNAVNAKDKLL